MISYDNETKIFHLDTPHTSYCMALIDGRYLSHLYYGERIGRSDLTYLLRLHDYILPPSERPDEMATFWDRLPHEYPTEGRGDLRFIEKRKRSPAFRPPLEIMPRPWRLT